MQGTEVAGIVAVGLLVIVAGYQGALALGAPWGQAAWGGQHPGVLPLRLRVASGLAALVVYPLAIMLVLAAAGLVDAIGLPVSGAIAMWVLTGLFAVGAVMNLVSRSRVERLWAPVAGAIALSCASIAIDI